MLVLIKPSDILPQNRTEAERPEFVRQPRSSNTEQNVLNRNRNGRDNRNDEEPT